MSVEIKREWATPIAAGAFLVTAVTGVLMFFHVDTGWNKVAHEWLSWLLVAGVALHLTVNLPGLKRYLGMRRGQWLVGGFAVLLALSFVPVGGKDEPPFLIPAKALATAPLSTVAMVAEVSPEELLARLAKAGVAADSDRRSVRDLVGDDVRGQVGLLAKVLEKP